MQKQVGLSIAYGKQKNIPEDQTEDHFLAAIFNEPKPIIIVGSSLS
jgi:hypothetical protein